MLKLQPRARTRTPHRPIDSFFESLAQDQRERAIGVDAVRHGERRHAGAGGDQGRGRHHVRAGRLGQVRLDAAQRGGGRLRGSRALAGGHRQRTRAASRKHPYVAGQLSDTRPSRGRGPRGRDRRTRTTARRCPQAGAGRRARTRRQARDEAERGEGRGADAANGYKKILLLLRNHSGVDFSLYKSTTIQRRITRRMVLNKQDTLEDYAAVSAGQRARNSTRSYSDVLISVTSFFRNPEAFDMLQREVFPKLLQQRGDEPIRVLGARAAPPARRPIPSPCRSRKRRRRRRACANSRCSPPTSTKSCWTRPATDSTPRRLAQDISPERLRRFFVEEEGGYRISKALREMVVFARQNLIADPPFSRMDLISCRNLLIYLEPSLQQKALPTFHYALKPEGFLFLGASESVGGFTELFEPVDKKHKIFSKKAAPTPAFQLPVRKERGRANRTRDSLPASSDATLGPKGVEPPESFRGELNAQREADRIAVNQFAPPGVLDQ